MTDLDRYGIFALAVVILLILFFALGEMTCEGEDSPGTIPRTEPDTPSLRVEGTGNHESEVTAPPAAAEETRGAREDFDFDEDPVQYPGSEAVPNPQRSERRMAAPLRHTVRRGESLISISQRYYGSSRHWSEIAEANGGLSPRKLKPGQEIVIPSRRAPSKKPTSSTPQIGKEKDRSEPGDTSGFLAAEHVVKKNETLGKISLRYYGTSKKWQKIFDANTDQLENPDRLVVGMKLQIPR